jgi:Flp pilus assembly protein TadD
LAQDEKWEEAAKQYEMSLNHTFMNGPAEHHLGIALANLGQMEKAAEHLFEAVKIDENNARWRYDLGMAWEELGRDVDAIHQFSEAVRLDPGFEEAKKSLAALRAKAAELK